MQDIYKWQKLVSLYVLAKKLEDTRSKNAFVDAIHAFIKEMVPKEPPADCMAELVVLDAIPTSGLFEGTKRGSPARKLVLDWSADQGREKWLTGGKETLPSDFWYGLAITMTRKRPSSLFGSMLDRPSSHYHETGVSKAQEAADASAQVPE